MKHLHYILIFLIAAMFSCRRHSYSPMLVAADSLCNVNVDSALSILDKAKPAAAAMCAADRWYYRLLCVKTADKAYIRHTSPTEIEAILHYYENGGDSRMLPEAYFYAGSVYRDLDNAPQAVEYYQKALECMPGKRGRLKGLCYWNICNLLELQGMYSVALPKLKETCKYCSDIKDTSLVLFTMREIGWCHKMLDNNDSALNVYDTALYIAKQGRNDNLVASLNNQKASILKKMKRYDEAEKALKQSMKYGDVRERSTVLSIASDLYIKTGRQDSAIILVKELAEKGDVSGKQLAYKLLGEHYIKNNCMEKAKECFIKYEALTDSLHRMAAEESVARMNSLYDYRHYEKENEMLKNNKRTMMFLVYSILVISVILLFMLFIIKRRNKKIILELSESNNKKIQVNNNEDSHIDDITEKDKGKDCQRLYYRMLHVKDVNQSNAVADEQVKKSDIYKKLLRVCNGNSVDENLDDKDWILLDETVTNNYPNWQNVLCKLCRMSEHEYHVCLLLKAGISPTNISIITNRSKSAINSTRQRLYEKNFGEKGSPSLWDNLIRSL